MDLPRQLLGVLFSVDEEQDTESLNKIVSRAPQEHIVKLLEYIREWNTNSRRCVLAHKVLQRILSLVAPEDLRKVPNMPELIRSMLLYSDRHFKRLEQLLQKSYLVDYTVQSMHILTSASTSSDTMFESESDEEEDEIHLRLPPVVEAVVAMRSLTAAEPEVMEVDEDAEDDGEEEEGDAEEGDDEEGGDDDDEEEVVAKGKETMQDDDDDDEDDEEDGEEEEEEEVPPPKKSGKAKTPAKEAPKSASKAAKATSKASAKKAAQVEAAVEDKEEEGPVLGPGGSHVLNAKAFDMLLPVGDSDDEPLEGFDDMGGNWGGNFEEKEAKTPASKGKKDESKTPKTKTPQATATPKPTAKSQQTPKATPKQANAKTPKHTKTPKATPAPQAATNVVATPKQPKATPKQPKATPGTASVATPAKSDKSSKKAAAGSQSARKPSAGQEGEGAPRSEKKRKQAPQTEKKATSNKGEKAPRWK
jgi:cell division septation protein DedD